MSHPAWTYEVPATLKQALAEIERLRGVLYKIAEDDEQEGHPCGPKEFGHFGRLALDGLNEKTKIVHR